MATVLPKSALHRRAALFCCLLTLLAALDPLPFLQVALGLPAAAMGFPQAPDDDEDEMLDLGREATAARASRREPWASSPAPVLTAAPRRIPSPSPGHALAAPACGHDRRNGIGGPLLC
jgi:hypothetical protein